MTRRDWVRSAVSTLVLPAAAATPEFRPLPAADQKSIDPALVAFLDHLQTITDKKDATALLALMAPVFRVEFAKGKGPAAFRTHWSPQRTDSEVWPILDRLLKVGGTFYSDSLFAIPYVYSRFPIDLDPLSNVVVLKQNAPVRSAADGGANVVAEASEEILALASPLELPVLVDRLPWFEVTTGSARGFISGMDAYSPAAHRAFFQKIAGKWRWISLVCADRESM